MSVFGDQLYITGFAVEGQVDEAKCAELVDEIVSIIRMTKDGMHAACWHFPAFDKGGEGFTYVQPIFESFIVADKWQFTSGGQGAYFVIASCMPYAASVPELVALFETEEDLTLLDFDTMVLSLDNGAKRVTNGGE